MKNLKTSEYLLTERQKITFSVFHAITVFFVISLTISFALDFLLLNSFSLREIFIYTLFLVILSSTLLIIKCVNVDWGTFIYTLTSFLFITILDYYSLLKFQSAIFLYSLPMSLCLLFFSKPVKLVFTTIFCMIIAVRITLQTNYNLQFKITYIFLMLGIVYVFSLITVLFTRIKGLKINSLKRINDTTIRVLGRISELRNSETESHLKRVEISIEILAESLRKEHRDYSGYITNEYIEDLKAAAYLHDIGKVGISDAILLKPGRLTKDEYLEMQNHTIIGHNLLKDAMQEIAHESLYDLALRIARHHHERWDGRDIPTG